MFSSFPRALGAALGGMLRGESRTPTLRHVEPAQPRAAAPSISPPMDQAPRAAALPESVPAAQPEQLEETRAVPSQGAARRKHGYASDQLRRKPGALPLTAAGRGPRPVRQMQQARPITEADAEAALSLATQARSTGYEGEAVERYRHVIERFPRTRAAGAAQVALGRLLYTELSQPAAALPLFAAYLARGGAQELAEEAMYHRGMCLIALQRTREASASFRQLLELFPGSMYAAQARAQLSRLPGP